MGIGSVAVYSDADADAPFVSEADEAIRLGPAPATESYLVIEKLIAAAKASGADAVHPGYGFLAEDARFARACADADLVFIGPRPETIELLASKIASKSLAQDNHVPVVPICDLSAPNTLDYPIMLKASAGGGGKGMQIVRSVGELEESLASAKRIAEAAFGDSTMLAESYIENPRHIEIQILGDKDGNVVHLYERDCSIQRRHQKVIEETPAPGLSDTQRETIAAAAVTLAKAAKYEGAGTVEFILAGTGDFYFLEVNTRLQVEHPVTEKVTGIDLVREQIRIAQGEALGYGQDDISKSGAAIECRLYAEDCEAGYLPCSGTLLDWHLPSVAGLRVDSGVQAGSEISIHYDPLIAKLIVHGPSRGEAIQLLLRTLRETSTAGLTSNRAFLARVLGHKAFVAGDIHTGFLDQHKSELAALPSSQETQDFALLAAICARYLQRQASPRVLPGLIPGFRNHRWRAERAGFRVRGEERWVGYQVERAGHLTMQVPVPGIGSEASRGSDAAMHTVRCVSYEGRDLVIECEGYRRKSRVTLGEGRAIVLIDGEEFDLEELPRFPEAKQEEIQGGCMAPMPAKVVKVLVQAGDKVSLGETLVVLEAMKMEHRIKADANGLVEALHVTEGDQVQSGQLLAVVTASVSPSN